MSHDTEWRDRALTWAGADGRRMLVDGRLVAASGGRVYSVSDPAEDEAVAEVPDAGVEDVDLAIRAAEAAATPWRRRPGAERAAVVRAMADLVERSADEIAALDSIDTGVPFWMTRIDIATGVARMRMFADWALRLTGETVPASGTHLSYTERVPFGVVARIVAYNHPGMFGISKIAAPLVAGNAVVLKPSELTPLSMLRLGELWADVVPGGVLSIITGATPEPGRRLVADTRVRRIAFTGSPATGRAIQRDAADAAVKSVSLELGGKNALVVLDDADLDLVVDGAVKGMNLSFAGQSCGSTSRLLVPAPLVDQVSDRLADRFAALRIGRPFDSGIQVSPVISAVHQARVGKHVEMALATTGRLVSGGGRPDGLERGHFFEPTIIAEKDPQSGLATEEVFGPVVTIVPTESTEQAIAVANSVRYGLTASVYGSDIGRALGVAGRMDAGYVWVNDTSTHFAGLPFGGVKESGVGREESFEELLDYTQIRATSVRLG